MIRLKILVAKSLIVLHSLAVVIYYNSPTQAQAQLVALPNGVGAGGLIPSFQSATSTFGLGSSITCPTPTFNLTGFGGDTDGSTRGFGGEFLSRATGEVTNWGIAAGFSVPLASKEIQDFCKRYAKAQADFQSSVANNQQLNSQLIVLQQCIYINDVLGINIQVNKVAFEKGGPLESFSGCLSLAGVLDASERKPSIQLSPTPKLPTEPSSKQATPVIITQ